MVFWEYGASESEQEFNNTSWGEKYSKNITAPAQGDYLILVSFAITNSSTGCSTIFRAQLDDTTTLMDGHHRSANVTKSEHYLTFHSLYLAENLSSGSHDIDIDAYIQYSAYYGYIRNIHVTVIRLDDWLATSGMYDFEGTEEETTFADSWTDLESLTFTPDTQGDYLVLASCELGNTTTSTESSLRIDYDSGTEYLPLKNTEETGETWITIEPYYASGDYFPMVWGGIVNIPASEKTIKLQGIANDVTATGKARKRRLIAIRIGAMDSSASTSENTSVTYTTVQWASKGVINFTPSSTSDYWILGSIIIKPDSESYPSHSEILHQLGTNTEQMALHNMDSREDYAWADCRPIFHSEIKSLDNEEQQFRPRYGYADTSGTTYGKGAWLVAIRKPSAETPKDVTDSGSGNDVLSNFNRLFPDSGSGIEEIFLQLEKLATDTGVGIDIILDLIRTIIDSGEGIDKLLELRRLLIELSSGTDYISELDRTMLDASSGDDISIGLNRTFDDSGSGIDSLLELERLFLDSGLGLDIIKELMRTISESGVGTDVIILELTKIATDSGSGTDIIIQLGRILIDSAQGIDNIFGNFTKIILDSGLGTDVLIEFIRTFFDSGTGIEQILTELTKQCFETCTGTDAIIKLERTIVESCVSTDLILEFARTIIESGSGIDVWIKELLISDSGTLNDFIIELYRKLSESGSGLDLIIDLSRIIKESGVTTDQIISLSRIILDSVIGTDVIKEVARVIVESGLATDKITELSRILIESGIGSEFLTYGFQSFITDSGLGTDIIIEIERTIGDSGIGIEFITELARIIVDIGTGIDESSKYQWGEIITLILSDNRLIKMLMKEIEEIQITLDESKHGGAQE